MRRVTGVIATILSLAAVTACSGSSASVTTGSAPHGTVTGTLTISGGAAPGTVQSTPGEISVFTTADLTGSPVATTKTAANGNFSVNLPAGTYYLAATSPNFKIDPPPAVPPCRADKPAVVSTGSTVTLDVVCSEK